MCPLFILLNEASLYLTIKSALCIFLKKRVFNFVQGIEKYAKVYNLLKGSSIIKASTPYLISYPTK
jgi:hypothetical protein